MSYTFRSLTELINTLNGAKELLTEMFGKRNSFSYQYDHALALSEENKVENLIAKGILTRNGSFLEIEDHFLGFFEHLLAANEEINTAYINENLNQLKENIEYYLQEDNESRKHRYLKVIKSILKRIGIIALRNVIDLNRNIDNTFKYEPNYRIKISKLKNYDGKREDINALIEQTRAVLLQDERTFFKTAVDEELTTILFELRKHLQESTHNLIHIQKQIIDYLNQVERQNQVIEKLRQIKYLKDQFELKEKTNITELLEQENTLLFERKQGVSLKLSEEVFLDDEVYALIKEINTKKITIAAPVLSLGDRLTDDDLLQNTEEEFFVNLEEMKNNFVASGNNLFDFVLNYTYPMVLNYEDKLMYYCQLLSNYEEEMTFTEEFRSNGKTEYALIYPR